MYIACVEAWRPQEEGQSDICWRTRTGHGWFDEGVVLATHQKHFSA